MDLNLGEGMPMQFLPSPRLPVIFLIPLLVSSLVKADSVPSAVQNAQAVFDEANSKFVVTWDPPPEGVTEYYLTYYIEKMEIITVSGDNQGLYGYEVERDYYYNYDESDSFPPSVTQIIMSAGSGGYGSEGRASIRPINNQGSGPTTSFDLVRPVDAPSPPSNLTYEIREDDLVAYFSWSAPSISYAPASAELYYKVTYVTDTGVSRSKYYTSNFAALDLSDNQYWDYHVSACIYDFCSAPSTIRAQLTTQLVDLVDGDFESGISADWIATGWQQRSGQTPSFGTGPGRAASGSSYVYFETSGGVSTGDEAILETVSDFKESNKLYFSYHMYGSTMGSLYVEIYEDSWNTVWSVTGQQHAGIYSAWTDVEIDLSGYEESDPRIRFRGVDGNGYRGDMAIDNIRITAAVEVAVAITGLNAEYSPHPHGLKISWDEISGHLYEVARSTDAGVTWDYSYHSGYGEQFIDSDIDDTSLTYYYRVRACSSSCTSWTSSPAAQ